MDGAIVVGLPIVVKINCRWSGSPGSIQRRVCVQEQRRQSLPHGTPMKKIISW